MYVSFFYFVYVFLLNSLSLIKSAYLWSARAFSFACLSIIFNDDQRNIKMVDHLKGIVPSEWLIMLFSSCQHLKKKQYSCVSDSQNITHNGTSTSPVSKESDQRRWIKECEEECKWMVNNETKIYFVDFFIHAHLLYGYVMLVRFVFF